MTVAEVDLMRARHAQNRIKQREILEEISEYLSSIKALPASVLQIGLGQAMAKLLASAGSNASNDPNRLLYEDVESWLCGDHEHAPYRGKPDLMTAIIQSDQSQYVRATAEAQCYLDWLKKLALAYLRAKNDG